jgi:putative Mg2+ transporter-C (MgtC) family protein
MKIDLMNLGASAFWSDFGKILLSYLLTLPIGWQREREEHAVGIRTFPLVAMASCGYLLLIHTQAPRDSAAESRLLQGLITGIGFIGAGAILKEGATVRGTATSASVWNTGVLGAAVALGRYEIAIILSALNLFTLRALLPLKLRLDEKANRKKQLSDGSEHHL